MKKIIENKIGGDALISFWKQVAGSLEKKASVFQVADFDNTLFDRECHLHEIPELLKNRGDLGPDFLFREYGMEKYIEKYYTGKTIPTEILENLDNKRDIVMTAGKSHDFQIAKVRKIKQLDGFRVVLTIDGLEKVTELIRYVLFELRYIPEKIIVYEDRPQFFVEYRNFIESCLGTKLVINLVEMDGNTGYKKIEEI